MRHGFKAKAERQSADARVALGISATGLLDPWDYAAHIGVIVLDMDQLGLTEDCRDRLLVTDSDSWSGMTIKEGEATAIVLNSSHARTRQCSTLMHELSHIQLKHTPTRVEVSQTGVLLLSDFSDEDEGEADWLAAAMLLPRDALIRFRGQGDTVSQLAARFGVSDQLCEWRLRMTGVDVQLRRAGRL